MANGEESELSTELPLIPHRPAGLGMGEGLVLCPAKLTASTSSNTDAIITLTLLMFRLQRRGREPLEAAFRQGRLSISAADGQ